MKYQNIDDEDLVPMIFLHERKPFSSRAKMISKIQLIGNKQVTLFVKLNR